MANLLKMKQCEKRLKNYCNLVPGDPGLVPEWWITIYCSIYYLLFYLLFYF